MSDEIFCPKCKRPNKPIARMSRSKGILTIIQGKKITELMPGSIITLKCPSKHSVDIEA